MMGSARSCVAASLTVCSVCVVCVHVYRSHKLLKTSVLNNDRLPSFAYLYMKCLFSAGSRRRKGCLYTAAPGHSVYTVLNCRLETVPLRRFCSAGGYGWDYPDSEYRDVPLCFPQCLCGRLLLMLLTDRGFRLSPAGLVCVRQSLKTLEPVDELKKGPFTLRGAVLVYRQVGEAGAEVDICLSATSRTGATVWESVLTLLSESRPQRRTSGQSLKSENKHEPEPQHVKQVELRVPRTTGLQSVWSLSDWWPCRLLSLPARLLGIRGPAASSLWMMSVCLAEIEKHKGVGVITAPVTITAHFEEPLLPPGRVAIGFWETGEDQGPGSAAPGLGFHMREHGGNKSHVVGLISRGPFQVAGYVETQGKFTQSKWIP